MSAKAGDADCPTKGTKNGLTKCGVSAPAAPASGTPSSPAASASRRRYETHDTSRNNWLVALLTFGEGWHNNHHYYMASARQGFFWWEVDFTWYILRALSGLGVVWDLRVPTSAIVDGGTKRIARLKQAA